MPATTQRATGKHAAPPRRHEKAAADIDHALEQTQSALALLRSDLGRDGKRIAADIDKLLRNARRDVGKLTRAIQSDMERATSDGTHLRTGQKSSGRRSGSAR